jgi:hypothetical protein
MRPLVWFFLSAAGAIDVARRLKTHDPTNSATNDYAKQPLIGCTHSPCLFDDSRCGIAARRVAARRGHDRNPKT